MSDAVAAPRDDLEARLRFETLLADLSAGFVKLAPDQVDGAVIDAQRRICETFDLDRSSLWEAIDAESEPWLLTHFHQRPHRPQVATGPTTKRSYDGSEPPPLGAPPVDMRGDAAAHFPWMVAQLRQGQTLALSNLDMLPTEAAGDRETLRLIGTKSTVVIPLLAGGVVRGALTFATMREERVWPEPIVNRLHLVAEVFASALARKQAEIERRRVLDDLQRARDRLRDENLFLRSEVAARRQYAQVTGQSPAIRLAIAQAERVAGATSTVLLVGETGTGKERFATLIHELSPRRERPMVRVNCAALPATLVESELFGREKGAYTGALSRQAGRFELANGSTIFLDEIGDLPAEVQVKLLRVLEVKQVERLGSPRPVPVDVRIIAATHEDLEKAVREGRFREDLYYRLNVFPIVVPPLRERREDIPLLAELFVEELAQTTGRRIDAIAKASMESLMRYGWPGNVRELRNVIERAMILATGSTLNINLAPPTVTVAQPPGLELREVERAHILAVLEQTGWRIRGPHGAARILGLKPTTLETRMARLDIRRPKRPGSSQ